MKIVVSHLKDLERNKAIKDRPANKMGMKKPFETLQKRYEAEARTHCAHLESEAESSTETQLLYMANSNLLSQD